MNNKKLIQKLISIYISTAFLCISIQVKAYGNYDNIRTWGSVCPEITLTPVPIDFQTIGYETVEQEIEADSQSGIDSDSDDEINGEIETSSDFDSDDDSDKSDDTNQKTTISKKSTSKKFSIIKTTQNLFNTFFGNPGKSIMTICGTIICYELLVPTSTREVIWGKLGRRAPFLTQPIDHVCNLLKATGNVADATVEVANLVSDGVVATCNGTRLLCENISRFFGCMCSGNSDERESSVQKLRKLQTEIRNDTLSFTRERTIQREIISKIDEIIEQVNTEEFLSVLREKERSKTSTSSRNTTTMNESESEKELKKKLGELSGMLIDMDNQSRVIRPRERERVKREAVDLLKEIHGSDFIQFSDKVLDDMLREHFFEFEGLYYTKSSVRNALERQKLKKMQDTMLDIEQKYVKKRRDTVERVLSIPHYTSKQEALEKIAIHIGISDSLTTTPEISDIQDIDKGHNRGSVNPSAPPISDLIGQLSERSREELLNKYVIELDGRYYPTMKLEKNELYAQLQTH